MFRIKNSSSFLLFRIVFCSVKSTSLSNSARFQSPPQLQRVFQCLIRTTYRKEGRKQIIKDADYTIFHLASYYYSILLNTLFQRISSVSKSTDFHTFQCRFSHNKLFWVTIPNNGIFGIHYFVACYKIVIFP